MSLNSPQYEERCSSGKQAFSRYGDALQRLQAIEAGRSKGGWRGSVYSCESRGRFHVTGRQFSLRRKKGRGKSRRGTVGI
jgi:hypothetical protein